MSTHNDRHFMAVPPTYKTESIYREPHYDRSFDSSRYPSNASQPSLSHSFSTYTESTPSSTCRPDFGDYPTDMTSDCGGSYSEVPPSLDDTSDIDEAPPSSIGHAKPSLLKFVEPVVQRDPGSGQPRLTGMKKKLHRKKAADPQYGEVGVHTLPVLGFADSRASYDTDETLHKDTLNFPSVPPRAVSVSPEREEWNVNTIDIALDDLMLDKGKAKAMLAFPEPAGDQVRLKAMRRAAAHSVFDEAQEQDKSVLPTPRSRTYSNVRRPPAGPPCDEPLPPLPTAKTPATVTPTIVPAENKPTALQPSIDHPLATTPTVSPRVAPSAHSSEENLFAFQPPRLPNQDDHQSTIRASRTTRSTGLSRLDSRASSNHSSLRDLDPREVIQRARLQPLSCGLDAEVSNQPNSPSDDVLTFDRRDAVYAEDLPPLLSNHYLHGKVDRAEYERLNRLPERMAAVAAASSSGQRIAHKQSSKNKKGVVAGSLYEPISILRAEAAFLGEESKGKKKKERLWSGSNSSSDVSMAEGGRGLKSLKSSMRLKSHK